MSDVVIALLAFLAGAVATYIACEMFMGIDDTYEFDDLAREDDDV
jgi:hypothetical protein